MSGFDIIYALSDESFDKSYKIYSIPSFVGYKKSQYIAAFLHIVAFTFLVLLWVNLGGFLSLTFLIFSGIAFSLAYKQSIPLNVRFFPFICNCRYMWVNGCFIRRIIMNLVLALTGASGSYVAKSIMKKSKWPITLIASKMGRMVYEQEVDDFLGLKKMQIKFGKTLI